ncbi:MAG TPA: hypothetical protein VIX80_03935 [Candidatus Kapabacteria bacterium]
MVKHTKQILFFLVLAFTAGCNPGITEPEPSVIKNVQDYFWDSNANSSLYYEYFRVVDSSRKQHEFAFYGLSGTDSKVTVRGKQAPDTSSFYFTFDSSGVTAGGLSYHTLFPLPYGYEVEASFSEKEFDTIKYGTKKVIALSNNSAIALRSDDSVFYSTNNGITWDKSFYKPEFGVITAWTRVIDSTSHLVYGGTSNGSCIVSNDGGKTWKLLKTIINDPISSIAATSTGVVFLSSGTKSVYNFDTNIGKVSTEGYPSVVSSLAVCEVYNDSDKTYPVCMIGTKQSGLFYWIQGKSQSKNSATGGTAAKNIISIVSTDRSSAVAIGYTDASKLSFLYSLTAGTSWETVDLPFKTGTFLDAVSSVSVAEILVADELGNVHLGSSQQGMRPWFKSSPSNAGFAIKDISINGNIIIAATDSVGVMISTNRGFSWTSASQGLWQVIVRERKIDGMLTLLPSLTDGLKKNDEWLAGYLSPIGIGMTAVIQMKAKVVEHYSRLDLPFNSGSYDDVFDIEYSCTPSNGKLHTVHVYYAKGFGPILFQRFEDSDLIDESYLVKK